MREARRAGIVLPAVLVLAQDFSATLNAFLGEHRRCGDLAGGVTDATAAHVVWISCSGCGARLRRWFPSDEPLLAESEEEERGGRS